MRFCTWTGTATATGTLMAIATACREKGVPTHPACSSPACLSGLEKNDTLALGSVILSQIPSSRCACYATSHDDNVCLGREFLGGTVSEQELIRLAVPERVGRSRCRECRSFVLHAVDACESQMTGGCGVEGEAAGTLCCINCDLYSPCLI